MTADTTVATSAARVSFGTRVREARVAAHMDQRELAEAAGCCVWQVQATEVGRCYLPGVIERIAEVLVIEPKAGE